MVALLPLRWQQQVVVVVVVVMVVGTRLKPSLPALDEMAAARRTAAMVVVLTVQSTSKTAPRSDGLVKPDEQHT